MAVATAIEERTDRPLSTEQSTPEVASDNRSDDQSFTEDDQQKFELHDAAFLKGERESIWHLRENHRGRYYRRQFGTLDDYMAARGHTRQWAYQQFNWLRRCELFEELTGFPFGKAPYQLGVEESQKLGPLEPDYDDEDCDHDLYAKLFVDAVIEAQGEAEAAGKPRTVDMTKHAVKKRVNLLANRDVYGDDLTLEESVQIDRLPSGTTDSKIRTLLDSAREGAVKEGRSSDECLKELVDEIVKDDERREKKQDLEADLQEAESAAAEIRGKLSVFSAEDEDMEEEHPVQDDEQVEEDDAEDGATADEMVLFDVELSTEVESLTGNASGRFGADDLGFLLTELIECIGDLTEGSITYKKVALESAEVPRKVE